MLYNTVTNGLSKYFSEKANEHKHSISELEAKKRNLRNAIYKDADNMEQNDAT